MFGGNRRTTLNRSHATRDVGVASETDDAECRQSGGIALRVSPRCHPGLRKVVGAAGFEPAAPCAQERGLASSCDVMRDSDCVQVSDPKRLDAGNRMTSRRPYRAAEPRGNPAEILFSRRRLVYDPLFQARIGLVGLPWASATKSWNALLGLGTEALDDFAMRVGEV